MMKNVRRMIIVTSGLCLSGVIVFATTKSNAESEKGTPATYEIVGDKVTTSQTTSSSASYDMVDTITAVGTEGGVQSSTNYTVEVSNNIDAQAPASNVDDWKALEK